VRWGRFEEFLTPAFWAERAWSWGRDGSLQNYTLGRSLREEVAACVLGGYGMPAELGLAAYDRLRESGLLTGEAQFVDIERALSSPFDLRGRSVRYRFARQKARLLTVALRDLAALEPFPECDRAFRNRLLVLPGVGLKTASWIARNWRGSDAVAILDVHICRACELAGVFPVGSRPERHYLDLESRFLDFAIALGVRASILDNLIWQTMRRIAPHLRRRHDESTH
jgi:thermostable 8-oxoguanine DNA glycosylase